MEHEFYNSISLIMICIYAVKKFGAQTANFLDEHCDDYNAALTDGRKQELTDVENNIKDLEKEKWRSGAQQMIIEIKKQNILMQLEAVYRERMLQVYNEVTSMFIF